MFLISLRFVRGLEEDRETPWSPKGFPEVPLSRAVTQGCEVLGLRCLFSISVIIVCSNFTRCALFSMHVLSFENPGLNTCLDYTVLEINWEARHFSNLVLNRS